MTNSNKDSTICQDLTIREALLSMAYVERKPGVWLKPIAYQCFTYSEAKNEWGNWFLAATGNISLWEYKAFNYDKEYAGDYLCQLKGFEAWTRTDLYVHGLSQFELGIWDIHL